MNARAARCHVLLEVAGPAPSKSESTAIRLFSKCRNELLRLPAFLRYYRKLGIGQFFIVDNDSSDGTLEYLAQQPDVRVFATRGRFSEARGGTDWLNALLSEFGAGHWCVTVDADELFCYPGSEHTALPALTSYLDATGAEALPCLLLDMYPPDALSRCTYVPGDDLLTAAPYFDPGPYSKSPFDRCPGYLMFGGPRERIFYPEYRVKRGTWFRRFCRLPPCLTKIPLVRWDPDTRYLNVNHFVSQKSLALETGALLHFKLLHDFHERAVQEAGRREYFDNASEYRRYASTLRVDPNMSFMYEGSTRFVDSHQLVDLNLIADTPAWAHARRASHSSGRSPLS